MHAASPHVEVDAIKNGGTTQGQGVAGAGAVAVRCDHRHFVTGFAPLVALGATSKFGLIAVGIYLLSGAVCTLIALRVNRQMRLRAV